MQDHYPFINTALPYAYDALEPYIDYKTMCLHHQRHLQTYIDNLNAALKEEPALQKLSLEELLQNAASLPEPLATTIANNAGGVYNHRFYFNGLSPQCSRPGQVMTTAIKRSFGSVEKMLDLLRDAALSVFGSGYAWLVVDRSGNLDVVTTKNQDTPLTEGLCPILNVDVWEHAYYLKHYNRRADYLTDWQCCINWAQADWRYTMACSAGEEESDCALQYIYRNRTSM